MPLTEERIAQFAERLYSVIRSGLASTSWAIVARTLRELEAEATAAERERSRELVCPECGELAANHRSWTAIGDRDGSTVVCPLAAERHRELFGEASARMAELAENYQFAEVPPPGLVMPVARAEHERRKEER